MSRDLHTDHSSSFCRSEPEIIYQIFPDRFRCARPETNPAPGAWHYHGKPIGVSTERTLLCNSPTDQFTFMGGDLEGIRQSLPYLRELGVTSVYLNPIFAARSTHRYDAIDFHRIDPVLGDRRDFERLAADLHASGMRLWLDGVFNHTSHEHPWHVDEALRKRFYAMRTESEAMTWMNSGHLPKLDTQNPDVLRAILDVVASWPEVDGWRLDAGHLLPRETLRAIRTAVAPRPVVVEDWHFGAHYFQQRLADGVTNFLFREAMRAFFIEDCSPETLAARLSTWIDGYPASAAARSWTFLDNHDTARFRTTVGPGRMERALVYLFTLPGTPLIFQGTEMGLDGRTEGESRAPIPWDEREWDQGVMGTVKRLIALRKDNPVLVEGSFRPLYADNRSRTLAFERVSPDARAVVAVNDGYHGSRFRIGTEAFDLDAGEWRVVLYSADGMRRQLGPAGV